MEVLNAPKYFLFATYLRVIETSEDLPSDEVNSITDLTMYKLGSGLKLCESIRDSSFLGIALSDQINWKQVTDSVLKDRTVQCRQMANCSIMTRS